MTPNMELIQKKQPNSLIRNGQGDITGLIDSSGRAVIEYRYDTWGKDCSYQPEYQEYLDLQELNPFRYRGYVYDTETGWYYLQSRYYDPATCRFISADILLSTGQGVLGHNMFAYCRNNPISRVDVTGHSDEETDEPDEPDGPDEPDIYDLIRGNIILAMIVRGAGLLAIRYPVVLCGSRLGWFYFLVKKDGPMDYKNQDRWESALPNLEYPGDDGEEKKYWFNGKLISASDLGNINYGAVGAALGIPLWLLLQQAGAAHRRDHMGDGFFESQFNSFKKGTGEHFGDQVDDYYNIELGYRLYKEGYFNVE